MGKDGSGEPASKKFKQSQLCFKSPKANGLKIKVPSPTKNENVCKSEKIHSSDSSLVNSDKNEDKSLNVDKSNILNTKVSSSPSGNACVKICETDLDNDKSEAVDKENSISESNKVNVNKIENVPMDVDPPTDIAPVSDECKPTTEKQKDVIKEKEMVKECTESSMDTSTSDSLPKKKLLISDDSKETPWENASDLNSPSKGDKSVLTDVSVTSVNETSSPCLSISSGSDDEGATSSSSAPVTPKTPKRQMTPKMLKRHEESVKKKQLLEQQKKERRAQKELLKNEKIKLKMEEEEKKKQQREERKKKRLAEIELKNEEKRLKQEDKRQKKEKEEEEKQRKKDQKTEEQRKEEEKKEQEKKKEQKTQAAFVNFFQKKQAVNKASPSPPTTAHVTNLPTSHQPSAQTNLKQQTFMPFHVKEDMKLCEHVRRELSEDEREILTKVLKGDLVKDTYLQVLKDRYSPRSSPATWPAPVSDDLHDCIVIEAQVEEQGVEDEEKCDDKSSKGLLNKSNQSKTTRRAKLLQFCENRRPAYFGTWTKNSKQVSGRTPFAKDEKGLLDYEVDSDSEWEEEEEGEDLESVKDDDNEAQEEEVKEGENGYLLDNTFVPHGYLSDEEQADDEDIHESVEKQKDRLVALKEEFDEEMKEGGAQALKPKLLGCLWVSNSTTQVSKGSLYEVLLSHRAVWDESSSGQGISMEPDSTPSVEKSPTQTPSAKQLPPIVLQEIARMVDGSRWPLSRLVREVGEVLSVARPQNPVSRLALTRSIKTMASKTLDSKQSSVWSIKAEFRSEYHLQDLEEVSTPVSPSPSKGKSLVKERTLDNFLRGQQHSSKSLSHQSLGAPPAKKRISLTPVAHPPHEEKVVSTPEEKKVAEAPLPKKKVAFVTLPPRTPGSTPQNRSIPRTPGPWSSSEKQSSLKPHVDTPRPPNNKFLNKESPAISETIEISDDSNL